MKTKKILGVIAVLMLVAVALIGVGAAKGSYDTIEKINAAITSSSGAITIDLSDNVIAAANEGIEVGNVKDVTIDLNGFKIDGELDGSGNRTANLITVQNGGKLRLIDSTQNPGEVKLEATGAGCGKYVIENAGTLEIENIKVSNTTGTDDHKGNSLIATGQIGNTDYSDAAITIKSGTFIQYKFNVLKLNAGSATIDGGTFITSKDYDNTILCNGKLTINGGDFTGTIRTLGYAERKDSGNVQVVTTVNGGKFDGRFVVGQYTDGTTSKPSYYDPKLIINGGEFTGDSVLYVGLTNTKGTINVAEYGDAIVELKGGSISVCDEYALDAALVQATGGTIRIGADIKIKMIDDEIPKIPTDVTVEVPAGVVLKTDENGIDIIGRLVVAGKFEGKITGLSADTLKIMEGGIVITSFGELEGISEGIEISECATLVIDDMNVSIDDVLGKVKTAKKGAVIVDKNSKEEKNGVEFTEDLTVGGVKKTKKVYVDAVMTGGKTDVGAEIPVSYIVTIPDKVEMTSSTPVAKVYSISMVTKGNVGTESVIMTLVGSTHYNSTNKEFYVSDVSGHTMKYKITKGGNPVVLNDVIVSCTVNDDDGETSEVVFQLDGGLTAGSYTDVLTFNVRVGTTPTA